MFLCVFDLLKISIIFCEKGVKVDSHKLTIGVFDESGC